MVSAISVSELSRARLAGHDRVEPTDAPASPRVGPELVAALHQYLGHVAVDLGREGTGTDARHVRLGDAHDRVSREARDPIRCTLRPRRGWTK